MVLRFRGFKAHSQGLQASQGGPAILSGRNGLTKSRHLGHPAGVEKGRSVERQDTAGTAIRLGLTRCGREFYLEALHLQTENGWSSEVERLTADLEVRTSLWMHFTLLASGGMSLCLL